MRSRTRIIAAAAVIFVVLLVVLAIVVQAASRGSHADSSALDPKLKQTALKLAAQLIRGGSLPVDDTTLKSFQAWVYNTETNYTKLTHGGTLGGQTIQVQAYDANVMPPQNLLIHVPKLQEVVVTPTLVDKALKSKKVACGTVVQGKVSYRACVAPLAAPVILRGAGVSGVVEVIKSSGSSHKSAS